MEKYEKTGFLSFLTTLIGHIFKISPSNLIFKVLVGLPWE